MYGPSTAADTRRIAAAVRPTDRAQLTEIVDVANRYRIPLYAVSTGRNWGYGTSNPVIDVCVVLDLAGLNRIIHFSLRNRLLVCLLTLGLDPRRGMEPERAAH